MATSEAIKRRVQRAKADFEEHSAKLFQQQIEWRDRQKGKALAGLFPSTEPGDRGATSPLDGRSPGVWSGKK